MKETVTINWLLLLAPFCKVLGISVLIFLAGLMEYRRAAFQQERIDNIAAPLFKRGAVTAGFLVVTGFLLGFLKPPSDNVIAVKTAVKENPPIPLVTGTLEFTPHRLKMDGHNNSHFLNNEKREDNIMVLFWDGYVQTPYMRFRQGNYRVTFRAKGSRADGVFSKLKVVFEAPGNGGYLETVTFMYIELTPRMEPYSMDFTAPAETPGRIRVSFFNDLQIPGSRKGRDVWLKDMAVEKRKK